MWHLAVDVLTVTLSTDFAVSGMLAGDTVLPIDVGRITMLTVVMSAAALILVVLTRGAAWLLHQG